MKLSYKISLFLGNILDHFDKALYGLLVPFLAPLFFPGDETMNAYAALFFPIGFLARPLGALFMGWMGDQFSEERALWISLHGICITTTLMGFLPTSAQMGSLSYVFLLILRALLSFFSAGEAIGAFLILIKDLAAKKKSLWASLFEASGILGTFMAIVSIALLSHYHKVEFLWRALFMISGIFSFYSILLRRKIMNEPLKIYQKPMEMIHLIVKKWKMLLILSTLGGFSYVNYEVVMALMNLFFSLKGNHTYESMLWMSAILLLVDIILLPIFGYIGEKIGKYPLLIGSLVAYMVLAPFWGYFLRQPELITLLVVRTALVVIGVAFCSSLKLQLLEMTKGESPYLLLALSKAIAAQCIGHPTIYFSLKLMQIRNSPALFLIYPFGLALISLLILIKEFQKKKIEKMASV